MSDATALLEPASEAMSAQELAAVHERSWQAQWDCRRGHSAFYMDKLGTRLRVPCRRTGAPSSLSSSFTDLHGAPEWWRTSQLQMSPEEAL